MSDVRPVVTVAQDLTEILRLHDDLLTQAVHKATDRLMPGGDVMVALGPVANLEAWQNRVDTAMRLAYEAGVNPPMLDDNDDEPPLQRLLFWSEAWRNERGYDLDGRTPTIVSEASFIRWTLEWAWENEVQWDDFAEEVKNTRAQMEQMLLAGTRAERGVQCFDCQVDLIRPSHDPRDPHRCEGHDGVCTIPHRYCPHDRGGLADEWKCPKCDRRYDIESYRRAVTHAHFVHASWLPIDLCAERTNVKAGTIKVWANRGKVAKRRDVESGRMMYHVEDVERHGSDEVA